MDSINSKPNDTKQKREYWLAHIQHWQESKLSQQAYCRQAEIKYGTFVSWRGLLKEKLKQSANKFIPLKIIPTVEKISTSDSVIQIKLVAGHVVTIPMQLDIKNIALLIKHLGDSHA